MLYIFTSSLLQFSTYLLFQVLTNFVDINFGLSPLLMWAMAQFEASASSSADEECWKLPEQDFVWDTASELALFQVPAYCHVHWSVGAG